MSTSCTSCGYRDNEVKSGSAVSDKGKKITLKVEAGEDGVEDLARDILKVCFRSTFSFSFQLLTYGRATLLLFQYLNSG